MPKLPLTGAGLGFRRELIPALQTQVPSPIQFFELAPENWARMGGASARILRSFTERHPFVCHGLSLSLGGPAPLDTELLGDIRRFMAQHGIQLYTEHLSWCGDAHPLHELLPLPCTEAAVRWTAARIRQTQDVLGCRIGIENASRYITPPGAEMDEADFIRAVVEEADCLLHLDVNNIYVNSQNFGFDPRIFLARLPLERCCYIHVAGHYQEADGFLIDTHGSPVIDPVWALLEDAYQHLRTRGLALPPTCLERDFNIPPLPELVAELQHITRRQQAAPALAEAL
ncbi:DUF692 domain-containing protein [Zoogloea sp.]|uniref:HvfB family MNIO-type RiPP peptide maturase n=1 Tax=Zoogloea sp. TaxID=49181 RepID=UPI0035B41258